MNDTVDFSAFPWPPDKGALEGIAKILDEATSATGRCAITCTHKTVTERGMRISVRDVDPSNRPDFIPDADFIALYPFQWALLFVYRALLTIPRFAHAQAEGTLLTNWRPTGTPATQGEGIFTFAIPSTTKIEHPATA